MNILNIYFCAFLIFYFRDDASRNSPILLVDRIAEFSSNRKFIVAVGDHDPPSFQKMSTDFNNVSVNTAS